MSARDCDREMTRGRLRKATGFFGAAQDLSALDDRGEARDAVVTLYIHAGIAAADVICCGRLGKHSQGENHAEAIALLRSASPPSSRHLATLLKMKTKAGYSHRLASASDVTKAERAAAGLLDSAREASA